MTTDLAGQVLAQQLLARERRQNPRMGLASRLLQQGSDTSPIASPLAGLARALTGAIGGYEMRQSETADRSAREADFAQMRDYQAEQRRAAADNMAALLSRFGLGGGPPAPMPQGPPQMPSAPPSGGPVGAAPLPAMPGVPQRGEAPHAVSQGIAARAALDPNAPDYVERLMAINNGVVAQTMPGQRMPGQGAPAPVREPAPWTAMGGQSAPPAAPAQPQAGGPDWRSLALAAAVSGDPDVQRLGPLAAQFAGRDAQPAPTVTMDGPQGPGVYERLPSGGVRFLGRTPDAAPLPQQTEEQRIRIAQAGRPQNIGTIPPGYQLVTGPNNELRMEPIANGPAAREQAQALRSAEETIGLIDGVLGHRALTLGTGLTGQLANAIPGTPTYDFGQRVAQLQGRAFLQAFESLKGGGQITEVEGRKATEAIARLSTAQSAEDFRTSLGELRAIVEQARIRAGGRPPEPQATVPGPNGGAAEPPPPAGGSPRVIEFDAQGRRVTR